MRSNRTHQRFQFHTSLILISSILFSSFQSQAQTTSTFSMSPPREPCQATIPAPLQKPKQIIPIGCDRPFKIHGEIYSTDSPQSQDASTLRYFVKSVPEADGYLSEYQQNRELSKTSAYIGTAGILMFLFSGLIANQFEEASQGPVRDALRIGGMTFATGGFFFTFAHLNQNERLIPQSVNAYNKAKPNDPIELQFSTGWRF